VSRSFYHNLGFTTCPTNRGNFTQHPPVLEILIEQVEHIFAIAASLLNSESCYYGSEPGGRNAEQNHEKEWPFQTLANNGDRSGLSNLKAVN